MIKSKLKKNLFYLFFVLFSCEKDDICIENEIGTPRIILSFYDKIDKNLKKPVENLLIKGLEKEDTLDIFSGDSIAIPLRNDSNFSKYEFILNAGGENSNNDTIHIFYSRYDLYINRACGFKSNFILNNPPTALFNKDNNWINEIVKLKDTVLNEDYSHLAIYH
tara:strand:- start:35 stop:526 length:492 start_codon:yes stop_codon:yes gene_type:complete